MKLSGAGLVAPFHDVIEAIRTCMTSAVGLVAPLDVNSELWKSGVGVMGYLKVKHSWERHGVNLASTDC